MKIASDKYRTMELAKKLGIKIPKTFDENETIGNFPVVIKGLKESGRIRYVNSFKELPKFKTDDSIVQEYIPGEGYGFFALFNKGGVRATFMHKRVREYPITGGLSTVAESIYDPKLKVLGLKLLESLNWHGVAMVEFKKDFRDGEFKLMEINPKFWGSLDLAIASGVDFPYLAVKMAEDGDVEPVFEYKTGIKFRWPFPDDLLHLLANPASAKPFFTDFFDRNTKHNIWLSDIKPNLFQVREASLTIISCIKNGNPKYPHGKPELNFMIFDLHIHSKYSFDSILEPKKIIKVAKKRGLDGVAITDHNTIKGGLEAKKINGDPNFLVIVGSEISTEIGDIIGLFLNEEIKSRNSMEVIKEIKEQGGLVVLPHPYRGHKLNEELIEKIDAIEVFNARSSKIENEKSAKLAERYGKPAVAGSDAHFSSEIGSGKTIISSKKEVKKDVLNEIIRLERYQSPSYLQSLSQIIKSIKMEEYRKIPIQVIPFVTKLIRQR